MKRKKEEKTERDKHKRRQIKLDKTMIYNTKSEENQKKIASKKKEIQTCCVDSQFSTS